MKKIILISIVVLFASILIKNCSNSSKPENYKSVKISDISYIYDPWNDYLGFNNGETIGIVIKVGTLSGKISIPFNYYAENCWGNTNRSAELSFEIDTEVNKEYYGKECLVIGTVDAISISKPRHACDYTYGKVTLKDSYIELLNN